MERNNSGQRFTPTKPTVKSMKDDSRSHRNFVQVPFRLRFSLFCRKKQLERKYIPVEETTAVGQGQTDN